MLRKPDLVYGYFYRLFQIFLSKPYAAYPHFFVNYNIISVEYIEKIYFCFDFKIDIYITCLCGILKEIFRIANKKAFCRCEQHYSFCVQKL